MENKIHEKKYITLVNESQKSEEKTTTHRKELIKEKENQILTNKNVYKIKIVYFFISEFGFILSLGLILLLLYIFPEYHYAKTFTSKISIKPFSSDYNIKIFLHTTDLHITDSQSKKIDGSSIFLTSFMEYNPNFIILTGDIVDNFKGKRLGSQNINHWKIYNYIISNFFSNYTVIDVAGNHDMWEVDSVTSKKNNFLNYSFIFNRTNIKDERNFYIKKIKLFGITFILLNDYRFPVIRPPYGAETHTNKKQLDILEDMINNLEDNNTFILSHYPVDRALLIKSSKGHSFEEIISNKKIGFIFTGHQHPKTVQIVHHSSEGGLEFCTPSAFDKKKGGLITIDNDNLIYHEVYIPHIENKTLFFLTYPVPNEQISSHHIFNLNNFEIRVISYYANNINLKIEGDIKGNFQNVRTLDNGANLYSYPVNLKNGSYKIHIYDENGLCDINTEFTVGNKFKGKKEKAINNPRFLLGKRFLIIPFWIFLFIIIFPFMPKLNFNIVKRIEGYIEGSTNNININKGLLYLYLIILSPFFLRHRYQEIERILKYSIFIAFLYPLVFPIHFFDKINEIIGYSFFVFVVVDSKIFYEHWALKMTFIFYGEIIFPYILPYFKYYFRNSSFKISFHKF